MRFSKCKCLLNLTREYNEYITLTITRFKFIFSYIYLIKNVIYKQTVYQENLGNGVSYIFYHIIMTIDDNNEKTQLNS